MTDSTVSNPTDNPQGAGDLAAELAAATKDAELARIRAEASEKAVRWYREDLQYYAGWQYRWSWYVLGAISGIVLALVVIGIVLGVSQ